MVSWGTTSAVVVQACFNHFISLQVDSPGAVSSVIFNFTATDQVANSFYSINSGPINFQELIFVPSDAKQSAVFSSN